MPLFRGSSKKKAGDANRASKARTQSTGSNQASKNTNRGTALLPSNPAEQPAMSKRKSKMQEFEE